MIIPSVWNSHLSILFLIYKSESFSKDKNKVSIITLIQFFKLKKFLIFYVLLILQKVINSLCFSYLLNSYQMVRTPSSNLIFFLKVYVFFFFFLILFLAVLGLRFCARAFSSCGKRGPLFIAMRGPVTIVASLVVEHRLQTHRLSSCGSRAQLLRGMWDLPRDRKSVV